MKDEFPITRKFAIWGGILTFPIFILFACLGEEKRGFTAYMSAMGLVLISRVFWDSKNRLWFWTAISILVVLHGVLVFFVPWPFPLHVGFGTLTLIGVVDFFINYGIIKLVVKVFERDSPPDLQS